MKVADCRDLSQQDILNRSLLLDLAEFSVRPMDRATNNVRQKELAAIDRNAEAA
jgi:hypothetical protein